MNATQTMLDPDAQVYELKRTSKKTRSYCTIFKNNFLTSNIYCLSLKYSLYPENEFGCWNDQYQFNANELLL